MIEGVLLRLLSLNLCFFSDRNKTDSTWLEERPFIDFYSFMPQNYNMVLKGEL